MKSEEKLVYPLHEVGQMLGYSTRTIRRMIDDGQIKALRIRARWVIAHSHLLEFLETLQSNRTKTT